MHKTYGYEKYYEAADFGITGFEAELDSNLIKNDDFYNKMVENTPFFDFFKSFSYFFQDNFHFFAIIPVFSAIILFSSGYFPKQTSQITYITLSRKFGSSTVYDRNMQKNGNPGIKIPFPPSHKKHFFIS